MLMSVQETQLINSKTIRDFFSWDRLSSQNIDADTLIAQTSDLLNKAVTIQDAAEIFYQLGTCIRYTTLYKGPKRLFLKDNAYRLFQDWLNQSFNPDAHLSHYTISHFYSAFSSMDIRMSSLMHDLLKSKIREGRSYFSPIDGAHIIDYYASTADEMDQDIFEIAVDPSLKERKAVYDKPLYGKALTLFLTNIAKIDAIFRNRVKTFQVSPLQQLYHLLRPYVLVEDKNEIPHKRLYQIDCWFGDKPFDFHLRYNQRPEVAEKLLDYLGKSGLHIVRDFNNQASSNSEIDVMVQSKNSNVPVGIICDTRGFYIEEMGIPKRYQPNGKTHFNSAVLGRENKDTRFLRIPYKVLDRSSASDIRESVERVAFLPPQIYGVGHGSSIHALRDFSFVV